MKKIFTSIVLALCISVSVLAQTTTINVQGQQHKVNATVAARIQKAAKAVASTGIDFSKIERWAGEGDCKAALAIKWADGQNDGKTLVWGYRWKSSEKKTGEDLIRAVAKADPAFYVLALSGTSFGTTFGGFGYDIDGNRNIIVTTPKNNEVYPRNGIVYVSSYVFDNCSATDITNDAWNSGWNKGFWSYNVADKAEDALGFSGTGASGRVLTDGCVDAWVFSKFSGASNEYDGNIKYLPATTDYTKGVFMVNEDWFGHNNSTTNYLTRDGKFVYNNTTEIGATACFGAAWGNRYYIIAKQAKDGGAKVEGGRITICDANTMRIIKQIKDINGNEDGRSFCGVDEHKAYVSTSRGIYTLNLDELTVGAAVKNADGGDTNLGLCGNMVRLGDYVYATEYGKSLRIIDCNTDRIVATISSAKVYSITMSKDGQLWVSTDKGISRVNTETNKLETISLPEGINVPANSNGAWCPDGLCASMQNNVIYWTSVSWNILKVFKYDINNNEFAKVVDLTNDADKWKMYSASNLRVDPVTDNLYVSLFKGWESQDYAVRIYDNNGTQLNEYELTQKHYWFPGMFVFPDVEDPIAGKIDAVTVEENKEVKVDLANVCSDADNFQAAIIKTIKDVSKENIATATVKDGKLVVKGLKEGSTVVTLNFCSNGISTKTTVRFFVTKATGITGTQTSADVREVARFTIDGKRINQPQRGINIVKYSDGTVKKVIVK
ncbi:DUF5074 domain-containing protein [Prevotella sp.]|uniref:DUF5074 domain-containing protein n=1 Tax=Prevotella sp. TaxID=59823 RepID=UPI0025D9FD7A|nr:DUF5074 domain-containing protein [Prevotella sp.]